MICSEIWGSRAWCSVSIGIPSPPPEHEGAYIVRIRQRGKRELLGRSRHLDSKRGSEDSSIGSSRSSSSNVRNKSRELGEEERRELHRSGEGFYLRGFPEIFSCFGRGSSGLRAQINLLVLDAAGGW